MVCCLPIIFVKLWNRWLNVRNWIYFLGWILILLGLGSEMMLHVSPFVTKHESRNLVRNHSPPIQKIEIQITIHRNSKWTWTAWNRLDLKFPIENQILHYFFEFCAFSAAKSWLRNWFMLHYWTDIEHRNAKINKQKSLNIWQMSIRNSNTSSDVK